MSQSAQIKAILEKNDYKLFLGGNGYPAQGQFVITGAQMGGTEEFRIGFCVQVRKGVGAYGSAVVFLRHASGALTTHENQGYFAMAPELEAAARKLFVMLPEDEDYSRGYTIQGEHAEFGFLIEPTGEAQPTSTSGASVHLKIEKTNEDGSKSATLIAFI
jgi:hypothetical protein